jgi:hypothetical protein
MKKETWKKEKWGMEDEWVLDVEVEKEKEKAGGLTNLLRKKGSLI